MKKLTFWFLYIITFFGFAQQEPNLASYKTTNEKQKAWAKYCKQISDQEEYSKLLSTAQKGIQMAQKQPVFLSRFYLYKGIAYEFSNNQYQKALTNYEICWKYAKETKHLKNETTALMRLNYMYYSLNDTAKSKFLAKYIKKILDTTKSTYTKAVLNGSLAEYYQNNSDYDTFINYQLRAITFKKLLEKSKINEENIGISYSQIAGAYIKMKQYAKAIDYLDEAKPYIKNSPYVSAFLCNYYIQCYVGLGEFNNIKKS